MLKIYIKSEPTIKPEIYNKLINENAITLAFAPSVAKELVYEFVRDYINDSVDKSVIVDSQFVLYALNNCMIRYLTENNDDTRHIPSLNTCDVEIKEIVGDEMIDAKNSLGTLSKNRFNILLNEIMDDYYDCLAYLPTQNKNDENKSN